MLEQLKDATNIAYTENGGRAYATTKSALLDWFTQGGALRKRSDDDVVSMFLSALSEDQLLALKSLFYFRDIRGGQGERSTFRTVLRYLAQTHPQLVLLNLHLIPEYGRWDDLFVLFDTPLEGSMIAYVRTQLHYDVKSDSPSLLAKWMPSENTSSVATRFTAMCLRKALGMSSKEYRQTLSKLRARIRIVETAITERRYGDIDYSHLPSQAGLKYRQAFYRNDGDRYREYIESVNKGESKINATTLYPYEIVRRVSGWQDSEVDNSLNAMWSNLPDYIGDNNENTIAVVDVSDSMSGLPMDVAVSLGMYIAERNKGPYHNHFITFSSRPQMVELQGISFCERVRNMKRADWAMNTNITAVFSLILQVAIDNHIPQDEMIGRIYIISDMEFDACVHGGNDTVVFEAIRQVYERHGYQMPRLVFWNVDARNTQFPMRMTDHGVQLVSGCSPSIFTALLKGEYLSAYDLMLSVLNSQRYNAIIV